MTTPLPTLLDAADAATYAGVQPATLRVWRLRYGMTPWRSRSGANLYALYELAEVLARREAQARPPLVTPPSYLDVLDAA